MTASASGGTSGEVLTGESFPSEVLRYLGHGGQPLTPELRERIDVMVARCEEVARPAVVRRTYRMGELPLSLPGRSIAEHLASACEVTLFAATLGHGIDWELRRLAVADPVGEVLFDAAATAAIERVADREEAQIRAEAAERGLFCSWRFSPGYGDLPLDVQAPFLAVLDATRRLGITLTPSSLMVPSKSVTALVGLHPDPQPGLAQSCSVCSLAEFCSLRSRGLRCR